VLFIILFSTSFADEHPFIFLLAQQTYALKESTSARSLWKRIQQVYTSEQHGDSGTEAGTLPVERAAPRACSCPLAWKGAIVVCKKRQCYALTTTMHCNWCEPSRHENAAMPWNTNGSCMCPRPDFCIKWSSSYYCVGWPQLTANKNSIIPKSCC